jgi:hypothetical protein
VTELNAKGQGNNITLSDPTGEIKGRGREEDDSCPSTHSKNCDSEEARKKHTHRHTLYSTLFGTSNQTRPADDAAAASSSFI